MGIKRYFVLALVFAVTLGLYVYSFNGQYFTLEALGVSVSLPIAVWIVIPVLIVVLASMLHMMFYSIKQYIDMRTHKKDYETFVKVAKASLLYEEIDTDYKTPWLDLASKLISRMQLREQASFEGIEQEELKELININNRIHAGEVVELKKYRLRQGNPLAIQNRLNKLDVNPKIATDILKEEMAHESPLFIKARNIFLKNASYAEIEKLELDLEKDDIIAILNRHVDSNDALHMENKALESLLSNPKMDKKSFNEAAKILQTKLSPDGLLALFERLHSDKAEASEAFLYVLFELQMIDRAREILDNSDSDDFEAFKLLLFLRDQGKHCDTTLFL